jgi:NAD(P)-dependent dehydrogenase (short-subunit alcohol dehydrogenase family)/acyl carrier protein
MLALGSDAIQLQAVLDPIPEGGFRATIYARAALGAWTAYAEGELPVPESSSINADLDAERLKATCLNHFSGPPLYANLRERGYAYGPAFRLLRQVWFDEAVALGEIDGGAVSPRPGFEFDPALLDACFHSGIALIGGSPGAHRYVPVEVAETRFLRSPQGQFHVRVDLKSLETDQAQADFSVFDAKGCCLLMEGVRFQVTEHRTAQGGDDGSFFYDQSWKSVADVNALPGVTGRWLVFEDRGGVVRRLASDLSQAGVEPLFVRRSGDLAMADDGLTCDPDDGNTLVRIIAEATKGGDIAAILYAYALDDDGWPNDYSSAAAETTMIARLIQAHAKVGRGKPPDLHLLTRLSQSVDGGPVENPLQAALWGFAKAIPFEHPNIRCHRIDLGPTEEDSLNADALLSLLTTERADDQFALRTGVILSPRLVRTDLTALRPDTRHLTDRGVYLVTGGTSLLGLRTLLALAEIRKGPLAVLSRTPPSATAEAVFGRLATAGVAVRHFNCDISDAKRLQAVVKTVEQEMGEIRGVIHLAGVLDDGAILNLTPDRIAAVLAPKVQGAANLCTALEGRELESFMMYSSVASILGSPGQASYMAANAVLDGLAHYLRGRGVPAMSVNWGPWAGEGMAKNLAKTPSDAFLKMFSPEAGQELIKALMRADVAQAVVLPFDVKPLVQFYPANAGVLYFEELMGGDLSAIRSDGGQERIHSRPQLKRPYVPPSNDIQRALCELWGRALGMTNIGIEDEFFELGGDSVFASQILAEINDTFLVNLDPELAFQQLTIANLARLIQEAGGSVDLRQDHFLA